MVKSKKFLVLALVVSMFMMIFSGCTKQEQSLAEAIKNSQDMKSCEEKSDLKFNLSLVSGGTADEKKMMIQAAPIINGLNIGMDAKVINKDNDAMKAYVKMNIDNTVMPIGFEVWADADKSGSVKEVIKSKELFDFMSDKDSDVKKILNGKEYFTVDTNEMMKTSELKKSGIDTKKFQEVLENYTKGINDLSKKMAEVKIQTGDSGIVSDKGEQTVKVNGEEVKAKLYEVKLTDSDFKKLLALNKDFSKNNEAIIKEFQKVFTDYMFGVMDATQSQDGNKGPTKEEMQKEMQKGIDEMSKYTGKFMEAVKKTGDIKILGDNGISIKYYVKDGNIVKSNSKVEFLIDMPKLIKLSQNVDAAFTGKKSEVKADVATGVYSFLIESNSDVYNINKLDDIKMPETNSKNSISVVEFSKQMDAAMKVKMEAEKKPVKKPVVKPATKVKPAAKSLNITVSKKAVLKNGYVSVDVLKSVKGSVVNSKGVIKLSVNGKVVTGKANSASFITSKNKVYVSIKVLKSMGVNIIVK